MIVHKLKIWPVFFIAVVNGKKFFEIRKMDRDYQVGDEILLQEYSHSESAYTGREVSCRITYIYRSNDFLKDNHGVIAIKMIDIPTEEKIEQIRSSSKSEIETVEALELLVRKLEHEVQSDRFFRLHLRQKLDKIIPMIPHQEQVDFEKLCEVLYLREMNDD